MHYMAVKKVEKTFDFMIYSYFKDSLLAADKRDEKF